MIHLNLFGNVNTLSILLIQEFYNTVRTEVKDNRICLRLKIWTKWINI